MIFERKYKIPLQVPLKTFEDRILGEHFKIHDIDFEVYDHVDNDMIKIIPHAEYVKKATTLPITHLNIIRDADNTPKNIEAQFHIRKIDKGLPLFFIILGIASLIIGIIGLNYENLVKTSYVFIGFGIVELIFTFLRLNRGYYDYVRKIKSWVETHAM